MTAKEELLEFIRTLTPAEVEKVTANLDTLKRIANTDEYTARVIAGFAERLTGI